VVYGTRKLNSKLAGYGRHLSSVPTCVKKESTAYGLSSSELQTGPKRICRIQRTLSRSGLSFSLLQ
jgi:hypothetical protein